MTSLYEKIFELTKEKLENPRALYTLNAQVEDFPALPSGIATIDDCLCGGLPRGRVIEIYGPEASGKTTVTLHFIAAAQKRDEVVCFIDAEHALDPTYAQRIGVDFNKLMFSQPDSGEQALEIVRVLCEMAQQVQEEEQKEANILVVVDSIPALIPAELWKIYEKEGFESSNALGAQARMLSSKLPMIINKASKSRVTVVFINQERDNIGVMYGPKTTTPGGRAIKFFTSLRLRVQRVGYYDVAGERQGIRTVMTPIKSKLFPIFNRKAEFIIGPNGIDQIISLVDVAVQLKIITKSGAWLTFGETKQRGLDTFVEALRNDPDVVKSLQEAVKSSGKKLKLPTQEPGDAKQVMAQAMKAG